MARTNIDIDDEACAAIMHRYRLGSKREAVNLALRTLAAGPLTLTAARRLRGSGWEGDLEEMRRMRQKVDYRPLAGGLSGTGPIIRPGYALYAP